MSDNASQGGQRRRRGAHFKQSSDTVEVRQPVRGAAQPVERIEAPVSYNPYTKVSTAGLYDARSRRRRRGSVLPAIIGLVVIAALAGGGWYAWKEFNRHFEVTVNGQQVTVEDGDTVAKLIAEGYATPNPGDLLAIDGSVCTEGGGEACAVTVNGQPGTPETALSRDCVVQVDDGADVTEDVTVTEETIPHGTSGDEATFDNYWSGSIHLMSDGQDGLKRVTTGNVSGITQEELVTPAIDGGFHIYTADTGGDKVIALTFDDGPWPETTDAILDILEENGAKATFFTIGNQIAEHPDQVRRAHEMGCQICTHTWDHAAGSGGGVNICYMSAEEQVNEVTQGYKAIADVIGEEPAHILRAPGGNFYGDAVTNLWDYVDAEIGWDVDTEDWSQPGSDYIAQMILSVKPGQVILMHDGGGDRWQTVEGLKQALPQLVEQGYTFVTIDELLAYGMPGEQPEA